MTDPITKVKDYKDELITKAEALITTGFPDTIVQLNELLATKAFADRDFHDVHQPINIPVPDVSADEDQNNGATAPKRSRPNDDADDAERTTCGTKVWALPSGPVHCNKPISDLITIVKPVIRKLVEDSNLLKMWISFMIPKIEDGNNFGVSIQEDTLAEIQSVESEAAAFFDQISRYFISRAKVVSKVAKYPHIEDYRRAVQELDEKEFLSLWLVMCEVRNRYSSLHDIVIKNLEKLKKPRSCNADSLY